MVFQTTVPLTTVFTPPASCASSWTYEGSQYNARSDGLLIQNALSTGRDPKCFPGGFDQYGRAVESSFILSPGACPAGYATAVTTLGGSGTTTAVCCPSGFKFTTEYSSANFQTISLNYQGCLSMFGSSSTSVAAVTTGLQTNSTVVTGPLTMWAQPLTIAFRQDELALFTTATSSTLPTATAAAGASGNANLPSQTGSPSAATSSNQSTGLSAGAIAGTAIGCAALIGLLIGLAIFFRRRTKVTEIYEPDEEQEVREYRASIAPQAPQELNGGKNFHHGQIEELPAKEYPAPELSGQSKPNFPRYELG